jgi:RNA polymerase sigma-70 factor (ECF subfamily)
MNNPVTVTPDQFLTVLSSHEKQLYNFIRKCLRYHEDSQDIYQNTVLKAFRNIARFRGGSTFKTWLFAIAGNEINRYFRKQKKNRLLLKSARNNPPAGTANGNPQLVAIHELATGLKPRYRQVFFLFYYSGFSLREITAITGIKTGTAKYILNNCREEIKSRLGVKKNEI